MYIYVCNRFQLHMCNFTINLQFCNLFRILMNIYNSAVHLQFCNTFTVPQYIYNSAIHLQFCNTLFTIRQRIYSSAIYLEFRNLFTILQYIIYNFQTLLNHRAKAYSCQRTMGFHFLIVCDLPLIQVTSDTGWPDMANFRKLGFFTLGSFLTI
jgi:hypothetical protein